MKRRNAIKTLAVAAGLGIPGVASGQTTTERGQLPNSTVPTRTIDAGGISGQPVPRDAWVVHRLGIHTIGDEGPESLREMVKVPEYRFFVNGEPVQNTDQFWSEIHGREEGQWGVEWTYALPPREEGVHHFQVEIHFPRPIRNMRAGGSTQVWKGTEMADCYYIVPESGEYDHSLEFDMLADESGGDLR